mgnify:CR=1 FL=1
MRTLFHYPLDAFGRIIRIFLYERSLDYQPIEEYPWNRKKVFSENHMFSDLPTLVENDTLVIQGAYSIIEYIEYNYRMQSKGSIRNKIEIDRIASLFNTYFFAEVTHKIIYEKIIKKYVEKAAPDSSSIRKGSQNIAKYFEYIAWLMNRRNWLAGDDFSLADISAAAHVSCLDYVDSIEWEKFPEVKDWYVRVKSRPSFREILNDKIPNIKPPEHYVNLDF